MAQAQINAPRGVEVTEEVKRLAKVCAAEGGIAAAIKDMSDKVRERLKDYLRSLSDRVRGSATSAVSSARDAGQDVVEDNPRLKRFAGQYGYLEEEDTARCPWDKVRRRLLNNNGRYLVLVEEMNLGGILFSVDKQGNPLFADDDKEPIMTNMNYADTRKAVYLKNQKGNWEANNMSGYEMFPYAGGEDGYDKSPEILAFEKFTRRPFVVSSTRKEWRSSWLESGASPRWPRYVSFSPKDNCAVVRDGLPGACDSTRGVRRLLRVKES